MVTNNRTEHEKIESDQERSLYEALLKAQNEKNSADEGKMLAQLGKYYMDIGAYEKATIALEEASAKFIITNKPDELSQVQKIREDLKKLRQESKPSEAPGPSEKLPLSLTEKSKILDEFIKLIIGDLDLKTVFDNIIKYVMRVTEADRAFLIVLDEEGKSHSEVILTRKNNGSGDNTLLKSFSRHITEEVLRTQQPICLNNVQSDQRFTSAESIVSLDIRSVICVPLKRDEAIIGLIYIDRQSFIDAFSPNDFSLVQSLAEYAAIALVNARLHSGIQDQLETSIRSIHEQKKTAKKLREVTGELKRSNKELEQFATVVSHDLKQPLRKIEEFAQLLIEKYKYNLDPQADEFITQIVDSTNRMRGLMNELFNFSLVGRKEIVREPTDLGTVLKSLLFDLDTLIKENSAEITFDHLPTIQANPHQFRQLFQNLINNAIKFRGPEPPSIHIAAKQEEDHSWIFSVRDNGIGIDLKHEKKIFEIFQRLHIKDRYPGSGIGLAVCKKIVEAYGGKIWIESEIGSGSTFYFTVTTKNQNKIQA